MIPDEGVTRKGFQALYYQVFYRTIGKKRLDEVLSILQSVGLLTEEPDPNDKRQKIFLVTGRGVFNFDTSKQTQLSEKLNTLQDVTTAFSIHEVISISTLPKIAIGSCDSCGKTNASLTQEVKTHNGKMTKICEDCGQHLKKIMQVEDYRK